MKKICITFFCIIFLQTFVQANCFEFYEDYYFDAECESPYAWILTSEDVTTWTDTYCSVPDPFDTTGRCLLYETLCIVSHVRYFQCCEYCAYNFDLMNSTKFDFCYAIQNEFSNPAIKNAANQLPLIHSSAICTAFVAAPLRMLSDTIQRFNPFFTDSSRRMRPTNVSSLSCAQTGIGYNFSIGLS